MVAVRCRPFNTREKAQNEAQIITTKEGGYISIDQPGEGMPPREFSFDYTYDDTSEQLTVYQNLGAPMLEKAFEGWNGTIFAYGQTGAGKVRALSRTCPTVFGATLVAAREDGSTDDSNPWWMSQCPPRAACPSPATQRHTAPHSATQRHTAPHSAVQRLPSAEPRWHA